MAYTEGASSGTMYCTICNMTFRLRDVRDLKRHEGMNRKNHPKAPDPRLGRKIPRKEG